MATATKPVFGTYTQCAYEVSDLVKKFPLVLDPNMPTDRIRWVGPVYGTDHQHAYACVPVDAAVGDRLIAADVWDSGTQMQVYEIAELDTAVGEEQAPWSPSRPTRRAIVRLVLTGRSHTERIS